MRQVYLFRQVMNTGQQSQNLKKVVSLINEWLEVKESRLLNPQIDESEVDLIQETDGYTFIIEVKNKADAPTVNTAIESLEKYLTRNTQLTKKLVPVIAVPYMGDTGRQLCAQKNISWLDLSGNAHIFAPRLKIHIEGKPNQFKSAGRPKDIFAPKSSRIARHLLIDPDRFISQRELTHEINLDEGRVSRVVREMENSNLLVRNTTGAVKPKNPAILLDAWYEKYTFSKHWIIKGHMAERSSQAILDKITERFVNEGISYAVTGLSAAWLMSHFAGYRTTTVYLFEAPDEQLLKNINFIKEERGSNVWLVIPNDEGVFDGAADFDAVRCVHPVQVYLDLKNHPERAKEAAEELRQTYLNWGSNAF